MYWAIASILQALTMGISTVLYKLSGKYFSNLKMNIIVGLISSILLYFVNMHQNTLNHWKYINKYTILIGLIFGIFNYFYIKSILAYHNPGINSSLLRSQIVLTYIILIVFFNNKLSYNKLFLILCIILGSLITVIKEDEIKDLILEDSKDNQVSNKKYDWIIYLIISIVLFSIYDILSEYKPRKMNINFHSMIVMICYFFVFLIIYIFKSFILKDDEKPVNIEDKYKTVSDLKKYICLISLSFLFCLQLIFLNIGLNNSPNPSYAKSIGSLAIPVALITNYIIFNKIPSIQQIIGCSIILISGLCIGFIK